MNFLLRSKRRVGRAKTFWWVGGFIILLLLLNLFTVNPLTGFLGRLGAPIWRAESFFSSVLSGWSAYFVSKEQLAFDKELLQAELDQARRGLLELESIKRDNPELAPEFKAPKLFVEILLKPPRTLYDNLVVDAGLDHGLASGELVVLDDVVLGRVAEVFQKQARVVLFSEPNSEVPVSVALTNGEAIEATAYGQGAGNFRIRLPKGVLVSKGDLITVPGAGGRFLGSVGEILTSPADPFQTVLFRYPVNFVTLRQVGIILPTESWPEAKRTL